MISFRPTNLGFTLIELVMVIVLVAVLGTMSVNYLSANRDAQNFELTKQKLDALKVAILGDLTVDSQGNRMHFGYHGDMGRLPTTLSNIITTESPAYTFNTYWGLGAGWRGPYLTKTFTNEADATKDAWGNSFVYQTTSDPASITSYGSDGNLGGSGFATDIAVYLPLSERMASVSGILMDDDSREDSITVNIAAPSNGSLTTTSTSTAASGAFSFSNVPFGLRAFTASSPVSFGPSRFVVDKASYLIPSTATNGNSSIEGISFGSATTGGSGNSRVDIPVTSTYQRDLTLKYIQVSFDRVSSGTDGYIVSVSLNGTTQTVGAVPPGTRIGISRNITMPQNSTQTLAITFSRNSNGSSNINMGNTRIRIVLEWSERGKVDAYSVSTP